MSAAPVPPLRILMLHGYTQSGPSFRSKTRALEKNLAKAFPAGVTLHYPTAPRRLSPADLTFKNGADTDAAANNNDEEVDAWGWWQHKSTSTSAEPGVYEGIEDSFDRLSEVLRTEGPFDGVIGFSQGGAVAAMLASLLEPARKAAFDAQKAHGGIDFPAAFLAAEDAASPIHPPLKFAVSYSGFAPIDNPRYRAFYHPKIQTPVLHFLGTLDTVVEEKRSLALVEACEKTENRVVYHPGGHFLPSSQKQWVGALVAFIREVMTSHGDKKEESVEDMDVPF